MRLPCPYCGDRAAEEFTYLGDAAVARPSAAADALADAVAAAYLRENPSGRHEELWHHVFGCRSWVRVTRDTRTHQVFAADLCRAPSL